MPLGSYPFSDRYGDKYGLSWQAILAGEREMKQRITPVLMFVGAVCDKMGYPVDSGSHNL